MKNQISDNFLRYPSTRYTGSKLQLLDWIWENVKELPFESVLDAFGGTGSVSLMFKRFGKQVFYNDLLRFNQTIGKAIIENRSVLVTDLDLQQVLNFDGDHYSNFIRNEFQGMFFLYEENEWLDKVVANIRTVQDKFKRSILFSALFQSCLAKRPFNLFHRANLYIRTNNVERSFGNKTTWEKPFDELLKKFVDEYNRAVFDNGKQNQVIGGYDALAAPNSVDLVYLDPPYFSASANSGTNYMAFYHFLEGLVNYPAWAEKIDYSRGKTKRIGDSPEITRWTQKSQITDTFKKLIEHFQESIIVLSYHSNGIPSYEEIMEMLHLYKKKVTVKNRHHRYVLSQSPSEELLFIAV